MKRAQYEMLPFMKEMDKGRELSVQKEMQEHVASYGYGVFLGLKTMFKQKINFDKALLDNDFSEMTYYVILFNSKPELLCSGGSILETDFLGKTYNQLGRSDIDQEMVWFSIIPTDTGIAAVFASLDRGEDTMSFFSSLSSLRVDTLSNAIARYAFEFYENTFFSPVWWKKLNKPSQQALMRRARSGIFDNIRRSDCLLDDGVDMVKWEINKIIKNLI